jgi:hypothetical protein
MLVVSKNCGLFAPRPNVLKQRVTASNRSRPMSAERADLLECAEQVLAALGPSTTVVIGGLAVFFLGVERYTADVDFASILPPAEIEQRLAKAGHSTQRTIAGTEDPLPWVIRGDCAGAPFQILPSAQTGITVEDAWRTPDGKLFVADLASIIRSKCIAGGMKDMHDVAVLMLLHPSCETVARAEASRYGVRDVLDRWLADKRLRKEYGR